MKNFGRDANGAQILTTTNPDNTIFCSSLENQLLATYRVVVRFDSKATKSQPREDLIGLYHPKNWNSNRKNSLLPPLPLPILATNKFSLLIAFSMIKEFQGICVGDSVNTVNLHKSHDFCNGKQGIVREMVKDVFVRFDVKILDDSLKTQIALANNENFLYPGLQKTWVSCTKIQVFCHSKKL